MGNYCLLNDILIESSEINSFFFIQFILLHKSTNSIFIAIKEIIKSTNGDMDFSEEFAII